MPGIKLKKGTRFFKPTTDMLYYDELLKNKKYAYEKKGIKAYIVYMTPDKYIREITRSENYFEYKKYVKWKKTSSAYEYSENMIDGDKFAFPILEYEGGQVIEQEGAHRTLAVQILIDSGCIKELDIPVGIFIRKKNKEWKGFFR